MGVKNTFLNIIPNPATRKENTSEFYDIKIKRKFCVDK